MQFFLSSPLLQKAIVRFIIEKSEPMRCQAASECSYKRLKLRFRKKESRSGDYARNCAFSAVDRFVSGHRNLLIELMCSHAIANWSWLRIKK